MGNNALDTEIVGIPNVLPKLYKDLGVYIREALGDNGAHNYTQREYA